MEQTEPGEREIDLKDMLWKILKSYRLLLMLAVIFAVVFGIFGFASSSHSEAQETEVFVEEETVERDELYEDLSQTERMNLDQAEQVYRQLLFATDEYDADPVRTADPYQITDISLQFYIRAQDEVNEDGTVLRSYVGDLQVAYGLLLQEEDVLTDLGEIMGIGAEKSGYVTDYVRTGTNGSGGFQVHLLNEDPDIARAMADYVTEVLKQGEKELSKSIGGHEMILIADTTTKGYNGTIDSIKQGRVEALSSLEEELGDTVQNLSDKTVEIFQYDTGLMIKEEDESRDVSVSEETTKESTSVLLYLVIGFVGGVLLGCVIVVLRYLFDGKIKTVEDVQTILGSGYFGALAKEEPDKKRVLCAIDRHLARFQYRYILHGTKEEQKMMTAKNFEIFCQKRGISSVYLSVEDHAGKGLAEQLAALLKDAGISACFGGNILKDEEALRQMTDCGNVLFFCETDNSRYAEVAAQANLARALDVNLLGAVTIL